MNQYKSYRILILSLLVVGLIWGIQHIGVIFTPMVVLVKTVAFPFAVAGIIYYLSLPLKNVLEKKFKWKTWMSTTIIMVSWVVVAFGLVSWMGPLLKAQVMDFSSNMPVIVEDLKMKVQMWEWEGKFESLPGDVTAGSIIHYVNDFYQDILNTLSSQVSSIVGTVTSFLMVSIMIPLLIFYILKDGHRLPVFVASRLKKNQRRDVMRILREMNEQLSSYVQGQVMVSLFVGTMMYIGFQAVGMEYALLLAMICFLTNFVPFLGPIIGSVPALVVAVLVSPWMMLKVGILILIIQQVESNLISPQVMGKKLNIHPLTIVVLLLVMGKLVGFVGFIIALPIYVVVKVIVVNGVRIYKVKKEKDMD